MNTCKTCKWWDDDPVYQLPSGAGIWAYLSQGKMKEYLAVVITKPTKGARYRPKPGKRRGWLSEHRTHFLDEQGWRWDNFDILSQSSKAAPEKRIPVSPNQWESAARMIGFSWE